MPYGDPTRSTSPSSALIFATGVHIARFLVILLAIQVAPLLGFTGWYTGLFANIVCVVFAVALVSALKMWRSSGIRTLWRSWRAALWSDGNGNRCGCVSTLRLASASSNAIAVLVQVVTE